MNKMLDYLNGYKRECVLAPLFKMLEATFDLFVPLVMADIVICPAVLERQAAEQQKPLRDHLAHLLIHGVLHAQGYDHLDDEEAEVMEARETEIMESLGFPNPYSDRIGMVHD